MAAPVNTVNVISVLRNIRHYNLEDQALCCLTVVHFRIGITQIPSYQAWQAQHPEIRQRGKLHHSRIESLLSLPYFLLHGKLLGFVPTHLRS